MIILIFNFSMNLDTLLQLSNNLMKNYEVVLQNLLDMN